MPLARGPSARDKMHGVRRSRIPVIALVLARQGFVWSFEGSGERDRQRLCVHPKGNGADEKSRANSTHRRDMPPLAGAFHQGEGGPDFKKSDPLAATPSPWPFAGAKLVLTCRRAARTPSVRRPRTKSAPGTEPPA